MDTRKRFFGTDGVRGVANLSLTCQMAFSLGSTAVQVLGPTLVIGRDTRISGSMLEAALVAGITSQGGHALLAGVIPTPAVALLTRELGADGGVVISASHNPPEYNGIKFFNAEGYKLSPELEDRLEAGLCVACVQDDGSRTSLPTGIDVGTAEPISDAHERYLRHAVHILERDGLSLTGLTIAVDCGNGAAHYTTPEALRRLHAKVVVINDEADGSVINVHSGSTDLGQLTQLVKHSGADLGLAHDGDADRVIAVSASGAEIDGDYIEAICALDRKATRGIPGNTVVSTVMCNIGFIEAMKEAGLQVVQTPVGDTQVLTTMLSGGYAIGGEQSGHMIFIEHNSTGDGLVTALMLLAALQRSGKSLDTLAAESMKKYPQTLINVQVADAERLEGHTALAEATAEAEAELQAGGGGRVLIRASGTEPLVRVMVEAADRDTAERIAQYLAGRVKAELT
ncbi:MAG: phosphoglucosamine mutase [Coriobacteriales bacterium]|jgi:phosphoglucosamine mutase|nr:phosphoglucosamine mutase [Coriobacteriales bacterium]